MPRPKQTKLQKISSSIQTRIWLKELLDITNSTNMNQLSSALDDLGGALQRGQLYDFQNAVKSPTKSTIDYVDTLVPGSKDSYNFGANASYLNEIISCDRSMINFYIRDQHINEHISNPEKVQFYWLLKLSLDVTGDLLASSRSTDRSFKSVIGGLARMLAEEDKRLLSSPFTVLAAILLVFRFGLYRSEYLYSYVPELSILVFDAIKNSHIKPALNSCHIFDDMINWAHLILKEWTAQEGNSIGESLMNFQGLPTRAEMMESSESFALRYQQVRCYDRKSHLHDNEQYFTEHFNLRNIHTRTNIDDLI